MYKSISVIVTKAVIATCLIIQKFCRICVTLIISRSVRAAILSWIGIVCSAHREERWLLLCFT